MQEYKDYEDDITIMHKKNKIIMIKKTSRLRYAYGISVSSIKSSAIELFDPKYPEGEYSVLNRNNDIVITFVKSNERTVRAVDLKVINIAEGELFRSNQVLIKGDIEAYFFKRYHNGSRVYLSEKVFGWIRKNFLDPGVLRFGGELFEDGQYVSEIDRQYIVEFLVEDNDILVLDVITPDIEIIGVFSKSKTGREVV